jgi:type I restriction enzyme, R subunit
MLPASNFGFLKAHDAQLAQLGALAERYFRDDPATAVFKLRQFAELLSKTIAAHHALYVGDREAFEETLRRLSYERIIPKEAADLFHALRRRETGQRTRPPAIIPMRCRR